MIRLHVDECVSAYLISALRRRSIDVVSAAELDLLGATDREHLAVATRGNRVILSSDQDFLRLAHEQISAGTPFVGLFFLLPDLPVGVAMRAIVELCRVLEPADMVNQIEWVSRAK